MEFSKIRFGINSFLASFDKIKNISNSSWIENIFEKVWTIYPWLRTFEECGGILIFWANQILEYVWPAWSWYLWKIHFLKIWYSQETTNPLKIPIPTPASDRGGPVTIACIGGPVFCTITSQDLKDSKKNDRPNIQRFHKPPSVIRKVPRSFQTYLRFDRICSCFKILPNYSRFTKIPRSHFPFLFRTLGHTNCSGPIRQKKNIMLLARLNIDRQDLVGRL